MKGQSTTAFVIWTFFFLLIGAIMIGVVSRNFFLAMVSGNLFINFILNYLWFFIISAGFLGFVAMSRGIR